MASLPNSKTVTYEEWLRMPVHEGREEVVNGEIRIMPPNKSPHTRTVAKLAAAFLRQLDTTRYDVFSSSFGLVIRKQPLTCREPDLAVFERATEVEVDGYFHSAPQLLIGVLSLSEDRKEIRGKLADYEEIGTEEVWLVSPEAHTVEVLYLQDRFLRSSEILNQGTLQPKHFPHVEIHIPEIWPD